MENCRPYSQIIKKARLISFYYSFSIINNVIFFINQHKTTSNNLCSLLLFKVFNQFPNHFNFGWIILLKHFQKNASHLVNKIFIPLHDLVDIVNKTLFIWFPAHRALFIIFNHINLYTWFTVSMCTWENLFGFIVKAYYTYFAIRLSSLFSRLVLLFVILLKHFF